MSWDDESNNESTYESFSDETTRDECQDKPKIALTPITSVKNADPNIRSITKVMKLFDGPLVIEPVWMATQKTTRLTGKRQNNVQPTQVKRIHKAVSPEPAFTKATLKAKRVHPTISFPTPADKATIPTVVSKSLSSVKIRHNTGNAVMENATPANSMKCVNSTDLSTNRLYNGTDNPEPRPNAAQGSQCENGDKNRDHLLGLTDDDPRQGDRY